jgi:hypothetical protein
VSEYGLSSVKRTTLPLSVTPTNPSAARATEGMARTERMAGRARERRSMADETGAGNERFRAFVW